jgi:hypothetical protein
MRDFVSVELQFRSTAEGGRQGPVFLGGKEGARYIPHLRVGPSGEHLGVVFVEGPAVTAPGESAIATAGLMYDVDYSELQPGTAFEILEGRRTVATGRVLRRWIADADWQPWHQNGPS